MLSVITPSACPVRTGGGFRVVGTGQELVGQPVLGVVDTCSRPGSRASAGYRRGAAWRARACTRPPCSPAGRGRESRGSGGRTGRGCVCRPRGWPSCRCSGRCNCRRGDSSCLRPRAAATRQRPSPVGLQRAHLVQVGQVRQRAAAAHAHRVLEEDELLAMVAVEDVHRDRDSSRRKPMSDVIGAESRQSTSNVGMFRARRIS